jgi:N-acetylneuraminic acid mutarotase
VSMRLDRLARTPAHFSEDRDMPERWIPRAAILLLAAATLLNTGCSSSTAPTIAGTTTGSLQLTVSGLPDAADAAITVTGPAGYSRVVATTTTLSALVPGSYSIAALNVFAANATYGPAQASQTVNVVATTIAAAASVPYEVLPSGWTNKASMSTARDFLAGGVVNGVLYAVGGLTPISAPANSVLASVEAYDPATNTWAAKAAMPTARYAFGIGVVNGIVYAVGGIDSASGSARRPVGTVEAYDPATNTWTAKAAMPTVRFTLAVGVVNGVLYAVGGQSGPGYVTTVEAYDPTTDTWTTKAPMSTARFGPAVGVVNGVLYAVGGQSGSSAYLATVEAYDPPTNTWTAKAAMPTARSHLAVCVVNGVLYALGGGNTGPPYVLPTVEAYDPATNTWTSKAPMSTARYALAGGVINGLLYAVGGDNGSTTTFTTVEAYTP